MIRTGAAFHENTPSAPRVGHAANHLLVKEVNMLIGVEY